MPKGNRSVYEQEVVAHSGNFGHGGSAQFAPLTSGQAYASE